MKKIKKVDTVEDLLRKLLIVQLTLAGVPQRETAKLLGLGTHPVNDVAKYIKVAKT